MGWRRRGRPGHRRCSRNRSGPGEAPIWASTAPLARLQTAPVAAPRWGRLPYTGYNAGNDSENPPHLQRREAELSGGGGVWPGPRFAKQPRQQRRTPARPTPAAGSGRFRGGEQAATASGSPGRSGGKRPGNPGRRYTRPGQSRSPGRFQSRPPGRHGRI